jgi:tetratricopeptide (TPR) repeat protein
MKRVFVILTALAFILSLSYTFPLAQESGEKAGEAGEQRSEEGRSLEPVLHPEEFERATNRRRMEQERRVSERPERLYDRLFAELERQREEIRALREEIAALRKMLEDQHASRKFQRDRRRRIRPRRWESRREPERREPERRDIQRAPDLHGQIRELEAGVERRPGDIELRMKLAHLYREAGKIEAAIEHYKAALEIDPDFDPPYRALQELGYRFPYESIERLEPLEDSVGEVISANEQEVELRTLEGEIVTFRVPSRQREDGSWMLREEYSRMAKSLEPGARVKIVWRESEGGKVIHAIERIEE